MGSTNSHRDTSRQDLYFLIAPYQILKNDVILINYGSFFQEKDSLQFNRFQFYKINKLLPNSSIFL